MFQGTPEMDMLEPVVEEVDISPGPHGPGSGGPGIVVIWYPRS